MSIYALLGYIFVCIWQPIQIAKVLMTRDVTSLSPPAIMSLAIGMVLIQIGLMRDKAKPIYIYGNGLAAVSSLVLVVLYFIYR